MLQQERRPPSGRDFAVFETVILGGQTTREAAEQFQLSQTRVCQIVERVQRWQAEVLPAESPYPEERLLRLAKNIAASRLDHLYCETMEAWRRSQGELTRSRTSQFGDDITTTFFSPGDPKYLIAAMRLAKAQAELGAGGGLACPEDNEEAESSRRDARQTTPPVGACSEKRELQPAAAPSVPPPQAATASQPATSGELSPRQAQARRQFLAPVQALPAAACSGQATTQIQVTPEQLGLSVAEILSRDQRRARKRARRAGQVVRVPR